LNHLFFTNDSLLFCRDPTVAKIMVAIHALKFCMALGLQNIRMEGDAKNVMDALNSKKENWSRMRHLVAGARTLLNGFNNWDINYVRRNVNFAAHHIAKMAVNVGIDKEWLGEIPDCILNIIQGEQSVTFD
jgi:ribonuclease HI